MGEVKLHGFWPSPFSCRIIWALKLKGVDHEYIEEDILSDKSELLLKYNPVYKMVPILVHNDKPIAESVIILEFIDETWPENPLLPEDPYERAQARFWVKFAADMVGPLVSAFIRASGDGLEKAAKEIIEALKIVEDEVLGDKKFFGGDALNILDIIYGFFAHWFVAWEELLNFKVIESHTLPRFYEWANVFKEVPAIKENLPDYDKVLPMTKFFRCVGEEQEKATNDSTEILKTIEEYGLKGKIFFGGDEIGLADIALGWIAHTLVAMEEAVGNIK